MNIAWAWPLSLLVGLLFLMWHDERRRERGVKLIPAKSKDCPKRCPICGAEPHHLCVEDDVVLMCQVHAARRDAG